MSNGSIYVYGARGHGKVLADILLARGDSEFLGFVDDDDKLHGERVLGFPVFGGQGWLEQQSQSGPVRVALGIGDSHGRERLAQRCEDLRIQVVTLVHPSASVSKTANLEPGSVVMAQAAINPNARVGRGAVINTGAIVEHDVEIGEFAQAAPNSAIGGASRLGPHSFLGMGAVMIQCVNVGRGTIVGAGSVVVRDLPDGVLAVGVPARVVRSVFEAVQT